MPLVGLLLIFAILALAPRVIHRPVPELTASAKGTPTTIPYPGSPTNDERFEATVRSYENVLYAKIPDPVLAAKRVSALRPSIERACQGTDVDPDLVAALIFLESQGDPFAMAPGGAAGLGQFIRDTAKAYGLKLEEPKRIKRLRAMIKKGDAFAAKKLAKLDERFDGKKALAATVRYLQDHIESLGGKADFAFAAYHMGQGNVTKILRAYCYKNRQYPWTDSEETVGEMIARHNLSWSNVLADISPLRHPRTYEVLSSLKDDSPSYWYRVNCAKRLLDLWQEKPKLFAANVLRYQKPVPRRGYQLADESHWYGKADRWVDWSELEAAVEANDLVCLNELKTKRVGLVVDPKLGETVDKDKRRLLCSARPELIALLGYIGSAVREESRSPEALLRVTSLVRNDDYTTQITGRTGERVFSTHSIGYGADIAVPNSENVKEALEFVLEELRHQGDIVWLLETKPPHYHVTLSPQGLERFKETYEVVCQVMNSSS